MQMLATTRHPAASQCRGPKAPAVQASALPWPLGDSLLVPAVSCVVHGLWLRALFHLLRCVPPCTWYLAAMSWYNPASVEFDERSDRWATSAAPSAPGLHARRRLTGRRPGSSCGCERFQLPHSLSPCTSTRPVPILLQSARRRAFRAQWKVPVASEIGVANP